MKRSKVKCIFFGLFALLAVSCLHSCTVNALKHEIKEIPLISDSVINNYGVTIQNSDLNFGWSDTSNMTGQLSDYNFYGNLVKGLSFNLAGWDHDYFYYDVEESDSNCVYRRGPYSIVDSSSTGNGIIVGIGMIPSWRFVSSSYEHSSYQNLGCEASASSGYVPFSGTFTPDYGTSNRLSSPKNPLLASSLPISVTTNMGTGLGNFPFYFDTIALGQASTSNGVVSSVTLKSSDFSDVNLNKMSNLEIPLGISRPDVVGDLVQGRNIEYRGQLIFPNVSFSDGTFKLSQNFRDNGDFYLQVSGVKITDSIYRNMHEDIDCQFAVNTLAPNGQFTTNLTFSCNGDLEHDYDYVSLRLILASSDWIWDADTDWEFGSFSVVTDRDETPGADWNIPCTGDSCNSRPGARSTTGQTDWAASLINLFNFHLVLPFDAFFALFRDNSTCVSIPILSSMLGSSETSYCPWFPASVRNIATPVVGLSASMLLFGFFVRWLKGTSEGLVETGSGVDSGGYHFENRFRRKK